MGRYRLVSKWGRPQNDNFNEKHYEEARCTIFKQTHIV